jgi:hypothetical protein
MRSRNHCCHGNATIRSLCTAVDLHAAVDIIQVFSVAMDMQQCVPFVLLSSYKLFRTAVNNINVLMS